MTNAQLHQLNSRLSGLIELKSPDDDDQQGNGGRVTAGIIGGAGVGVGGYYGANALAKKFPDAADSVTKAAQRTGAYGQAVYSEAKGAANAYQRMTGARGMAKGAAGKTAIAGLLQKVKGIKFAEPVPTNMIELSEKIDSLTLRA